MIASIGFRPRDWVFLAPFALYTVLSVALLVLGLGAALAVSEPVRDRFLQWAQAGGVAGFFWETMGRAARLSEPLPTLLADYFLSILNVACGLLLVWRRPRDWTARLLAIGMIGTAMGFNYQAHAAVGTASGNPASGGLGDMGAAKALNILHFFFHAVSGAAYVHALLLFPDGRLVPRFLRWLPFVLYAIAIEEVGRSIWGRTFAPGAEAQTNPTPPAIVDIFNKIFDVRPLANFQGLVRAEITFFVLLFGFLIPVVGIISQIYHYRRAASPEERAQSQLMLGALTFAFMDPGEAKFWVDEYYETFKHECTPIGRAVNPNIAMLTGFMCHPDRDLALTRGIEGLEFFKYGLAHYYRFGEHVPGRTSLWDAFKKVPPPPMAGVGGIGTPDDVRENFAKLEAAGVDQLILLHQGGKYQHEHICESLELFGSAVLQDFEERHEQSQRAKAERLAPYIAKALERVPDEPIHDIPTVDAYPILWEKQGVSSALTPKRSVDGAAVWKMHVGGVRPASTAGREETAP